ncbi:MAG: SpoIID/LytB domain-containing protein [Candidatus Cloacimonetes bacterium]|nr:SpoIID/LytB domain-containing protein [Candidatus Cloacimonadota bacterium]
MIFGIIKYPVIIAIFERIGKSMKKKLIFISFLIFIISIYSNSGIIIEVHIADNVQQTITTESSLFYIQSGDLIESIETNTILVKSSNRVISINDKEYGEIVYVYAENNLSLNNNSYLGEFKLLLTQNNQVRVINRLNLEDYVAGVIVAEIGGNAPVEALKAQAVATRTISVRHIRNGRHRADGYDLCSNTHCQVYRGLTGQTPLSLQTVHDTASMILLSEIQTPSIWSGDIETVVELMSENTEAIEAVYSSHCGGISENSGDLWVTQHSYLSSKIDNYCIHIDLMPSWSRRHINWERDFTIQELENMFSIRNISEISINVINSSMRIEEVLIKSSSNDVLITGQYELRNRFDLPSSLFFIQREGEKVKFIGNGHGHGVGMCQIGSIVRALQGHDFKDILSFYYEGVNIGVLKTD